MKRPNFFIVGAPKCGTTALYEYLRTHPQVYLATPKELRYFDDDLRERFRDCRDEKSYLARFFGQANGRHKAIGEASPTYLYSESAIANIRKFNPDARLIVMLRNPADMAYSLHSQHVFCFSEDEKDFMKAWRLQEPRKSGRFIPKTCPEPAFLQYRKYISFGGQLQRAYSQFPREQVKVIFLEDLRRNPQMVYWEILRFLELAPDYRCEFPVINASKGHRIEWLAMLLYRVPLPVIRWARPIKRILGIEKISLIGLASKLNRVEISRPPLPHDVRQEILAAVRSDIEILENLTGHDLSCWKCGSVHAGANHTMAAVAPTLSPCFCGDRVGNFDIKIP